MKEIQIYENALFGQVRTSVTEQGEPLFCLADVCRALALTNPSEVKRRLQQRGVCTIDTPTTNQYGTMVNQQINFITEPNLYKCIFQSRKKEAEAFQDWVCSEVLPSIRKNGGYMVARADETPEELMTRAMELAKAALERQRKTAKLYKDERELVDAFCALSQPSYRWARPISLEELAAMLRKRGYDTGKKRLTSWLRKKGYIHRQYGKYDQPTELALRRHYFEIDKVATINNRGEVFIDYKVMISLAGQADLIEEFIEDHGGGESDLNSWFFGCKEEGGAQ